jgi:PAS domain S-box-containing protein
MPDAELTALPRLHFFSGGGEMAERCRAHDWAATPLGPPERWPESLKVLVGVMLGSAQPMFISWGPERIMLYNDGYAPMLGQRHPDALGRRFEQVWYDILDDVLPILDRAYAGEGTQMDDIAFTMHRNGYPEEAHFAFSYTPVRAASGAVEGMFCACEETTRRIMAQRNRATEVDRLRRLLDDAPGFMAVVAGPDHRFYVANRAYSEAIGESEVVGRAFAEIFPPDLYPDAIAPIEQVIRTGESMAAQGVVVELPARGLLPARELVLDYVIQPIVEQDHILGVFIAGNDVTARHQAEQELRESEERFRLIADSAPVPIWVSNPDRTRNFINRAYVDFVGLDYEAAARLDWRTILHPDDHDRVVQESIAGEAGLKPFTLEARYRRGDGQWRWIRSTSQPRWGPNHEANGFIGVAHDVTDAKQAEAALRGLNETLERRVAERTADLQAALERLQEEVAERARAEEALRQAQKMEAVGQLTGGIAHDFNNLLTPIIGGLEMITRKVEEPRLQRIAQGAYESAQRGAKLATQLLAFSRIQRIAMAPVDVNRVIGEMMRILHHSIGLRIEICTLLPGEVGHALCDANQLENAILNLAINARDAMPDGGCLTISTGLHEEPENPDLAAGAYVCITVSDTGQGMPPDVLARATEPFFSTKPIGKGTGLGLAQVYGIARQSGGTVRIESREGEGTAVHILLPQVAADRRRPGQATIRAETGAAVKAEAAEILVVDDDPEVRQFLTHALVELGHRVVACDCAEAALEELARSGHDLVMIDFAMPGMNGAQLAEEIRRRRPDQRLVFVTGYAETGQIEKAAGPGAALLRKPFSIDQLASLLDRVRA